VKTAGVAVCLITLAVIAVSADTKPVKNRDGNCTLSVPASWTVGSFGDASSADKKVSLIVSSPKHGLDSLTQVQQMAPGIYKDDKVVKSSASEFEMEGKSANGKPNVYRAVPAGDKVCIVEITYQNGDTAGAKAIVETLKASK
jgi:hypothetical protein